MTHWKCFCFLVILALYGTPLRNCDVKIIEMTLDLYNRVFLAQSCVSEYIIVIDYKNYFFNV